MLEFKALERGQLFFDHYQYSICVQIPEAGCLRAKSLVELNHNIEYRNLARQRWASIRDIISKETATNLVETWELLDSIRDQIKFTTSFNTMYVYSNSIDALKKVIALKHIKFKYAQEAVLTLPRDVIVKRDPKYKLRSYFKDKSLDLDAFNRLRDFLIQRGDCFALTSSLRGNLKHARWPYLQRHWFIEHNDMKDLTMLALVCPGTIRKTMPIQAK